MPALQRDMPLTIIQTLFQARRPLARHIDGFKARAPQLEMAEAVSRAIKQGGRLLVEAGTGTGKTYAYLVPALESGKRVVISTGSKNLQEQLFYRDLPTITGALHYPRRWHCSRGAAITSASSG